MTTSPHDSQALPRHKRAWEWLRTPIGIGTAGTVIIALASIGAGAVRYRGGLTDALGLSFLTFGHGFAISELTLWLGIALLVAGWVRLGVQFFPLRAGADSPITDTTADFAPQMARIKRALWLWVIPLALAGPLFSRDVYSYLMQGAMVRDGFDPYTQGAAVNSGPYLLEVSGDWRNTTTPYGPLHLCLGEGITTVVGNHVAAGVILFRIVAVLGFATICWAIPLIAKKLGANPAFALWLGVLNPVVILHLVGGIHNDAIMVAFVSLALVVSLYSRNWIALVGSAALIGVAVAVKATGVIALPFLVWILVHRQRAHSASDTTTATHPVKYFFTLLPRAIVVGIAQVAVMLATLAAITVASSQTWGWISEISGNTKVVNPLAAPSAAATVISWLLSYFDDSLTFNVVVTYTRAISALMMVLGLVLCWVLFHQNRRRSVAGIVAAYTVACVFNAVVLPWYYASVLTLIGTVRPRLWVVRVTVFATILLSFSFSGGGNNRFYELPWMVVVTLIAFFTTRWLTAEKSRQPEYAAS